VQRSVRFARRSFSVYSRDLFSSSGQGTIFFSLFLSICMHQPSDTRELIVVFRGHEHLVMSVLLNFSIAEIESQTTPT